MDCKKEESGDIGQSTWQNGGPCPEMEPISCLLLAHILLEMPSNIPVGVLRALWGVGDVSLGPGERSRLRTYWRHHCGRGRDGGRWWQRPMKSLPRLSLPRGCAPEKSQTVPSGAHPPSPGSHSPPPPPSFSSHLLSLCGWREGVAILGSLHPTMNRGKSFRGIGASPSLLETRSVWSPGPPHPALVCHQSETRVSLLLAGAIWAPPRL